MTAVVCVVIFLWLVILVVQRSRGRFINQQRYRERRREDELARYKRDGMLLTMISKQTEVLQLLIDKQSNPPETPPT